MCLVPSLCYFHDVFQHNCDFLGWLPPEPDGLAPLLNMEARLSVISKAFKGPVLISFVFCETNCDQIQDFLLAQFHLSGQGSFLLPLGVWRKKVWFNVFSRITDIYEGGLLVQPWRSPGEGILIDF